MEENFVNNGCRKSCRFLVLVMFIASYNSDDFFKNERGDFAFI